MKTRPRFGCQLFFNEIKILDCILIHQLALSGSTECLHLSRLFMGSENKIACWSEYNKMRPADILANCPHSNVANPDHHPSCYQKTFLTLSNSHSMGQISKSREQLNIKEFFQYI